MGEQTVESLIEGGQATAAPPLGPQLGPLGVNIGEVVSSINEKTEDFEGMQVPIKVIVDTDTKDYRIEVGTPPAAALILKEAALEGGSGKPLEEHIADMKIEQVIKIANMKENDLLAKDDWGRVKEIIGACNSMGVMVEGMHAAEAIQAVNDGQFDEKIEQGKTELSDEQLQELEERKEELQEQIEKKHEQEKERAQEIKDSFETEERGEIVAKMRMEGISEEIINEVVPPEPGAEIGMAKQGSAGGEEQEAAGDEEEGEDEGE